MEPLKPIDVRRAGMDLLAFREHSVQEMVEKLSRRFKKRRDSIANRDSNSHTFSNNAFGKKTFNSKPSDKFSGNKRSSNKLSGNKFASKKTFSNASYCDDDADCSADDDDLFPEETSAADEYNKAQLQEADLDVIVEQVQQLRGENLQSDQRYAESFLRSRVNKGQGPQRIRNEMISRGVAESLVAEVFAEAQVDWDEVIAELAQRKYRDSVANDDKERAKRVRFYLYRGFSYEHIKNLEY